MVYAPASNAGVGAHSLAPPPPGFSDIRYVRGVAGQPFVEVFGPGDCCAADSPRAIAQYEAAASRANNPATGTRTTRGAARGERRRAHRAGSSDRETAVRHPRGDQSRRGRNRVAGAARRHTGQRANHPALKGLTIPKTGQTGSVGLLVTKTLVIMGDPQATTTSRGPRGAMLHAYDKATGAKSARVVARASERIADDVHGRRPAVHRRRGQRRELFRGISRVPIAELNEERKTKN